MRRTGSAILLATGLLGALPAVAEASAWTRPEGTHYLKLAVRTLVGRQAFREGRTTVELPAGYQDHQLALYGEYGVTDEVTAVLEATPFGVAHYDGETDPYIGSMIAGLRYRLQAAPFPIAVQVHAGGRPAHVSPTGTAVVDGRTYVITPLVGTLLAGASLAAGQSFERTWVTGHVGARFHSAEALEPAFYAFLQGGWHIFDALTAALHVTWWHSLGETEPINVLGTGQTRYLGYGLGLTWWLSEHIGLQAGIDGAVFADANAATPGLQLGIEIR